MVDELNIRDQKLGILPLRTIWMVPNISVTLLLFSDGANGLRWGGVNVHPNDGAREMQMMMPQLPYRQLRAAQTQTSMWTFANYGKPPWGILPIKINIGGDFSCPWFKFCFSSGGVNVRPLSDGVKGATPSPPSTCRPTCPWTEIRSWKALSEHPYDGARGHHLWGNHIIAFKLSFLKYSLLIPYKTPWKHIAMSTYSRSLQLMLAYYPRLIR